MLKLMKKLFAGMSNFDFDFDFNDALFGMILGTIIILWMKALFTLWSSRIFFDMF